jgi:hypothetical protein
VSALESTDAGTLQKMPSTANHHVPERTFRIFMKSVHVVGYGLDALFPEYSVHEILLRPDEGAHVWAHLSVDTYEATHVRGHE